MILSSTFLAAFLSMTPAYETSTQTQQFRSTRPVREARPLSMSGELGVRGPAGMGLLLSWSPSPHWSFDGGMGFGLSGPNVGLQGRWNLLKSNLTPYIGLGVGQAFGLNGPIDIDGARIDITAKQNVQSSVGISYVNANGFTMLAGLGYAVVLQDTLYEVESGRPDRSQRDALDAVLGSGPLVSLAFGYSFKV